MQEDLASEQSKISLPIVDLGVEAAKEKKGRSSVFMLHFWWARKPLVTSRASILSALLPPDILEKKLDELLGIGGKQRAYNYNPDDDELKKLYLAKVGKEVPTLFDPFGGGGSIGLEALRLGLSVISSDYNPVAHNIQLGTLLYPKMYPDVLWKRVKKGFEILRLRLEQKLKKFYPSEGEMETSCYMYAWGIQCPYCEQITPAVNNWILKKKAIRKGVYSWVYIVPTVKDGRVHFNIIEEEGGKPSQLQEGTCYRGEVECLLCHSVIPNHNVLQSIQKDEHEIPLCRVMVNRERRGKQYLLFRDVDTIEYHRLEEAVKDNFLPDGEMPLRIIASARYLKYWFKLFNLRQRVFFTNFAYEAVKVAEEFSIKYGDVWGKILATYFAMFLGKSVDFNNRGSSWAAKEGIRNSLAFRRPSMAWDHVEVNPFAPKGSGTWRVVERNILDGIREAVNYLRDTPGKIEVKYSSIFDIELDTKVDLVVTDPPYGDDVQYSELSEFFYVWEKFILTKFYDYFPEDVNLEEDISVNNKDRDDDYASFALRHAFIKLNKSLIDEGQLVLFFAHGKLKTWAGVIDSLRRSGFQINATLPVHTESKDNVIALGKASFMTSILVYCTKRRKDAGTAYIEDLYHTIVQRIRERISEYRSYNLKESDLSMILLGPALQELTSYSELISMSGELTLEKILEVTNKPLVEELLGGEVTNSLDGVTKLYLYCKLMDIHEISFDSLHLLSKSIGIDLGKITEFPILAQVRKGKNKTFRLLDMKRVITDDQQTYLIDFLHQKMQEYQKEKIDEETFWENVEKSSFETREIIHVLDILSKGQNKKKEVKRLLDQEARIATEFLRML